MKMHYFISAALTVAAFASIAHADDSWEVHNCAQLVADLRKSNFSSADRKGKDVCAKSVAAIKASGAKKIHYAWKESPYLKFGGVLAGDGVDISFENATKMCAEYERFWTLTENVKEIDSIASSLKGSYNESVENAKVAVDEADRCTKLVAEIVAAGFPPTRPVELIQGGIPNTTLADLEPKVCEVWRTRGKALAAKLEAEEAPLRKALKGDKLDFALSRKDTQFYGVGMKELSTPAQMAASKLWFIHSWSEDRSCRSNDAPVHTVRRFQYDAKHMLVSETSKEFCGPPPKSAFR